MGYAQRYGLAVGAFAIASGAIAPLSAQADTQITQLKYKGTINLFLEEFTIPPIDFETSIQVNDLENRLTSGGNLTPTFSQIKDLLGGSLPDTFFDILEVKEFEGSGFVFASEGDDLPGLTNFDFRYVDSDQDGESLEIDGYLDAFKDGTLDQCLDGTCFISGSASGEAILPFTTTGQPEEFDLRFAFSQKATLLDSGDSPPDDGVAVPEPSVGLGLLAIAGGGLLLKRRQDRAKQLEAA